MSTDKVSKINYLLSTQPSGVVLLTRYLGKLGYSIDLLKRYKTSQWLESIGTGAIKRFGDDVSYEGAIYALQKHANLSIHPGGKTALSLLGKSHYLALSPKQVVLFGTKGERLPSWFQKYDWGIKIDYHSFAFLPPDVGLVEIEFKSFSIKVSGAIRAMMECLSLAPQKQDLVECYQLMEGLNNLKPDQVQSLLEQCRSIKIKRLFLYLADKSNHEWFSYLDLEKINLGSGKRSIVTNGVYVSKYKITVPQELEK